MGAKLNKVRNNLKRCEEEIKSSLLNSEMEENVHDEEEMEQHRRAWIYRDIKEPNMGNDNNNEEDSVDCERVIRLAPFASSNTLDKLILQLKEKSDFNKIVRLAPFISKETIEKMVLGAFDNGDKIDWSFIKRLAPFASNETLNILISKIEKDTDFHNIIAIAPFLDSDTIEKLILDAFHNGDNPNWDMIIRLAPFASGDTLEMLIAELEISDDINKIMELAPFLNSDTIDRLINEKF